MTTWGSLDAGARTVIATLVVDAFLRFPAGAPVGAIPLTLSQATVCDPSANSIATTTTDGSIIVDAMEGDLNVDGLVDVQDVQACANHVLGLQNWGIAADVNEDGGTNILDVQRVVNIVSGL